MFATTTLAAFTNSTDANFRLWGQAFSVKLGEAGLVQTSDTGQINWVTVTAPLASNTFQGYEIWRFADSLQATAPVYMKIEYGSGGSTNNPAIRFQFGSGSNGSGTITGVLSVQRTTQGVASAGTVNNYWSGATGRFCAFMGGGVNTSTPILFSIERSKDASGNDTSEAVLVIWKNSGSGSAASTFAAVAWDTATGDKTTGETVNGISALLPSVGTGITGSQIATYPIFHTKGVFMNPGMNLQVYYTADLVALSLPSIPMYGSNRTYIALGATNAQAVVTRASTTANGLLMRYE